MSSKLTSVEQSNYNYWSKRTSTQYAYKKVLNIDPDLIAEIERLYEGSGIMEVIENRDKLRSKGLLPDFPEIPNDRLFDYVMAKHEFDMKYLRK